jgi:hypothetical protein
MPPSTNEPTNQPNEGQLPSPPPPPPLPSPQAMGPADQPPVVLPPQQTYGPASTPVLPEPVAMSGGGSGRSRKKLWLFVGLIVLVLLLIAGYGFAYYLPNQPDNVYKDALSRSAQAVDKLTAYVGIQSHKDYKSSKFESSFKFTSSSVSGDGTLTAAMNDTDVDAKLNVDIAGEKLAANVRSIKASGQDQPDVYVQVKGIKGLLDNFGLTSLDTLDGQWVSIDHTLLDSAAANLDKGSKANIVAPTEAQVQDALTKWNEVNKQYIFAASGSHAVLKNEKYLGKSTRDGRSVYGYEVGYDKTQLKAYIDAVQKALASSSLDAWVKQTTGKSVGDMATADLKKAVDDANGKYTFTMYVDAQTKLISALHFKNPSSSDYFEITQGYTGGSSYPFGFKMVATSDPSLKGTLTLNASINTTNDVTKVDANFDGTDGGHSPVTFKFNGSSTPSKDTVHVDTPTGSKPLMDVIKSLHLDGLFGGASGQSGGTASDLPFTLTQ